jgi:hypothetical protein
MSGDIDQTQAGQILFKLQTASVNLRNVGSLPGKADHES